MIHQFIDSLEFAEAQQIENITYWPILKGPGGASSSVAYKTFESSLLDGSAEISEVSESGVVGELQFFNRSSEPIFLLDGEQVIGLKQNRTFNLSMIAPPNGRVTIPVSCLELGRWARMSTAARSAQHVHFAEGRARKMRRVSGSLSEDHSFASDQDEVWSDISSRFDAAHMSSATGAEADYFDAVEDSLEKIVSRLTIEENQVGSAFAVGGRLIGLDVFGSPEIFRDLAPKLARSYASEALKAVDPDGETGPGPKELLDELRQLEPTAYPAPGAGETLRWQTHRVTAAALVDGGKCVHLAAFPAGRRNKTRSWSRTSGRENT